MAVVVAVVVAVLICVFVAGQECNVLESTYKIREEKEKEEERGRRIHRKGVGGWERGAS